SVLLDATWAGALEPATSSSHARARAAGGHFTRSTNATVEVPRMLGELGSPERCLAVRRLDSLDLDAVLGVDHWLARSLGLTRRESELPTPQLGQASPGRWPQLDIT